MTVSSSTNRISYAGNDSTTVFAYTFKIFADGDLTVTLRDAAGDETEQVLDTDYTVSGAGEESGGNVTMVTPPATGETLVIVRQLDLLQETDYVENDPFPAETHEEALDRACMMIQQLNEILGRSVKLPISSPSSEIEIPEPSAGKALKWNAGEDALENSTYDPDTSVAAAAASAAAAALAKIAAELAETNAAAAQAAAEAAAASLNIATPVASKYGALLFQNDDDDGYDLLGDQGTAGQVLTSNGPDAAPSFQASKDDVQDMNILLNAFRIAINGSLVQFDMVDGIMDEFEDESGVDTAASTGEAYDSANDLYSPAIGTSWSDTLDSDVAFGEYTVRQVAAAGSISTSGSKIRVTLEAGSGEGLTVDNVAIVERDGSTGNGTTTPTEILFSGASGFTIALGETKTSDWLTYALDETKDYLLIADIGSNSSLDSIRRVLSGGDGVYYKTATNSYNTQNLDTPVWAADYTYVFNKIEVANDMSLQSNATEAEANPNTVRIVLMEEDVDSVTLNTDIKAWASRDDGANWVQVTLVKEGTYETGKQILTGTADVSGQASDKTIKWKVTTHNGKDLKIHGVGELWS